jgi:hypothetical protein
LGLLQNQIAGKNGKADGKELLRLWQEKEQGGVPVFEVGEISWRLVNLTSF